MMHILTPLEEFQMNNLKKLNKKTLDFIKELHPNDFDFAFISGSIVRGGFSKFSDIDYTACVSEKFEHPRFNFKVIQYEGRPRVVSIYFYLTNELLRKEEEIDEEYWLWEKQMMLNCDFIGGNKSLFDKAVKTAKNTNYSRGIDPKTFHKSLGKLLELLVKVRKYLDKKDVKMMSYYGFKLAEHARRIIAEINPKLSLRSESEFLNANLNFTDTPKGFKTFYPLIAGYSLSTLDEKEYFRRCKKLVKILFKFVSENKIFPDKFTEALINEKSYLDLFESLSI